MTPRIRLLLCVVALVSGWAIGRYSSKPVDGQTVSTPLPASSSVPPSAAPAAPRLTEEEAARIEQALMNAAHGSTPEHKIYNTYDAVLKIPPGEIALIVEHVRHLPETESRDWLLMCLVARWAEIDPRAVADFTAALDDRSRLPKLTFVTQMWAKTDAMAAWEWAQTLPQVLESAAASRGVVEELAVRDPAAALQMILSPSWSGRAGYGNPQLFATWAEQDAPAAAKAVLTLPPGGDRNLSTGALMAHWMAADRSAALAWAEQIATPSLRRRALTSAYRSWAKDDPPAAKAAILALPAGDDRERLVGDVVATSDGKTD
jgi:hypothetical protein